MTRKEFSEKYDEMFGAEVLTSDVLMRIASNLSDIQDGFTPNGVNDKLNSLKEYIFDYISVERSEKMKSIESQVVI